MTLKDLYEPLRRLKGEARVLHARTVLERLKEQNPRGSVLGTAASVMCLFGFSGQEVCDGLEALIRAQKEMEREDC